MPSVSSFPLSLFPVTTPSDTHAGTVQLGRKLLEKINGSHRPEGHLVYARLSQRQALHPRHLHQPMVRADRKQKTHCVSATLYLQTRDRCRCWVAIAPMHRSGPWERQSTNDGGNVPFPTIKIGALQYIYMCDANTHIYKHHTNKYILFFCLYN